MVASKSSLMSNLVEKEKTSNKCYDILRKFIFLSIHNIILVIIIIVSMMISGLISVYYIIFSLYFLITSTRIYLGSKYYYPKAIKVILRISILVDIFLQILYQSPYIDTKNNSDNTKTTIYTILEIIGLNKILSFDISETGDFDAIVDGEQMILVMAKAFIYLFMSLQVLVYSSQYFQEYYLSYIITKKQNLRIISLINVFRFNNKRIEVMEKSIKLRQEMSKEMEKLEKTLEKWNEKLMKFNENQSSLLLPNPESVNSSKLNEVKETEKDENNGDKNIEEKSLDKEEKKEESKIMQLGDNLLLNLKKANSHSFQPKNNDEIEDTENNLNIEKEEQLKAANFIRNSLFLKNPFDDEDESEEYVSEQEVIETIKEWILGGLLIRLQIKFHRYAANYNNISKYEKDIYEKDTIQGKI